MKLMLNRAMSVRFDEREQKLFIAVNPPFAATIEQPPKFVLPLLLFATEPRSRVELTEYISSTTANSTSELQTDVIDDLVSMRVLVPATSAEVGGERYDRHELFYTLLGRNFGDGFRVLSGKRVGLIGSGGIGSTCAMLLVAAGVGEILLSDGDLLEASNLTRTVLFRENDVGKKKIDAAADHLRKLNSNVRVSVLDRQFGGDTETKKEFEDFLSKCDIFILSADLPVTVHRWANEIALKTGVPYLNAGYIECSGVVGPTIVPGQTACYQCETLNSKDEARFVDLPQLNSNFQASSFGPLNALVASIASNEVIRFLLGVPLATLGNRIIFDSNNYNVTFRPFHEHEDCPCRPRRSATPFDKLAEIYSQERDSDSLNALLVDPLFDSLIPKTKTCRVLDLGCGVGTLSRKAAEMGHSVLGIDVSREMCDEFERRIKAVDAKQIRVVCGDIRQYTSDERFDLVFANLVLDHIEELDSILRAISRYTEPLGTLIATLPHPFKDSGTWDKVRIGNEWTFRGFSVDGYFQEGTQSFTRENAKGDPVMLGLRRQKRTLSTYINAFSNAGFDLVEMHEPRTPLEQADQSANHMKSSRIPYFLILKYCKRLST